MLNQLYETNQSLYQQNRLKDFDIQDIDREKILKLINGLNQHKAHGLDRISIRMLKLSNLTITKPLSIIYKQLPSARRFSR